MASKRKRPDPTASVPPPELSRKPRDEGPGRVYAAIFLAIIAAVVAGVAMHDGRVDNADHNPLESADRRELELIVRAVSVIIQTPSNEPQEPPVRALEAIHPQSAGASDLHDACVTTYRGVIELERLRDELVRLVPLDAGVAPPAENQTRAAELLERSTQLLREVNQTRGRCTSLYEDAARRLGVQPARRMH